MWLLLVAKIWNLPGDFIFQLSYTRWPLWIFIRRTTFPKVLTNDRIIEILPCSDETCWNGLMFFIPSTLISFVTFWTPVSSPDQIWAEETIPTPVCIFFKRLNHCIINVGFAPIIHAINRFLAFFNVILGCLAKTPSVIFGWQFVCYHWSLQDFTFAYWYASCKPLLLWEGIHSVETAQLFWLSRSHRLEYKFREHACRQKWEWPSLTLKSYCVTWNSPASKTHSSPVSTQHACHTSNFPHYRTWDSQKTVFMQIWFLDFSSLARPRVVFLFS